MKGGIRQSMAWLHGWAGLLLGWILYLVFLTGTLAFLRVEITAWMQPEIGRAADARTALVGAVAHLALAAPDAAVWEAFTEGARGGPTDLRWTVPNPAGGAPVRRRASLDPATGQPSAARATAGGNFFYTVHYQLHYLPREVSRYAVGVAAMAMLVAILSGIVTHRRIFADFFTLRFGKGQRSWLDAHNVTAVLALPFHLMITYTGLVTLATVYMPWGIEATYGSQAKFIEALHQRPKLPVPNAPPAETAPLGPMIDQATAAWDGAAPGRLRITNPGTAAMRVELARGAADRLSIGREIAVFDGLSGRLLSIETNPGMVRKVFNVMVGLHAGRFADPLVRTLYIVSGIAGTAMVATGLILWTAARRRKAGPRPSLGFRIVERLNIATIAGLPLATAAYFLANRLLPTGLADRPSWEIHAFFLAWAATLAWTLARPVARVWFELLAGSAACFAAIPLVNALVTDRHLLASLRRQDWLFAGFDLSMLGTAVVLAVIALYAQPRAAATRGIVTA